jgi:hypothetical protein
MLRCKRTFWLENPPELLCDYRVIPTDNMGISKQLNAITRLIIFITIILYLVGYKHSILFALISLTVIIISYYMQKSSKNIKENYNFLPNNKMNSIVPINQQIQQINQTLNSNKKEYEYKFGNANIYTKEVPIKYGEGNFHQYNQALAGTANPKTHKAPIIPPRAFDLDVWRDNDFVQHSNLNTDRRALSCDNGYEFKPSCCDYEQQIENYGPSSSPRDRRMRNRSKQEDNDIDIDLEIIDMPIISEPYTKPVIEKYSVDGSNINSAYELPNRVPNDYYVVKRPNKQANLSPGDVNTTCCYDSSNVNYNLPVNYQKSNIQTLDSFKKYNENIFTVNNGENSVEKLEIIEPTSWNIGISFDQQIPPTTRQTKDGKTFYVRNNPRDFVPPPVELVNPFSEEPRPENVYDPRYTGYGTSYRSYTDELTGQPRFYYDDINAVRKGNYFVRSKIDFLKEGEQTGIMKSNEEIKNLNQNIRDIANQAYTDDTIKFREELQYSYMRKRNSDMWQKRVAPIRGGGCNKHY